MAFKQLLFQKIKGEMAERTKILLGSAILHAGVRGCAAAQEDHLATLLHGYG